MKKNDCSDFYCGALLPDTRNNPPPHTTNMKLGKPTWKGMPLFWLSYKAI